MRRAALLAVLTAALLRPGRLEGQAVVASAAHWFASPPVSDYRLAVSRADAGPFALSPFAQVALRGPRADRALLVGAGAELAARLGGGVSLLAGASAGFLDLGGTLGLGLWGSWSTGLAAELLRMGPVAFSLEARYQELSRGGVSGVSLGGRLGTPLRRDRPRSPPASAPPPAVPAGAAGTVVRAAVDAMGTPYQWGGNDGNGFDCSGLIQFAYAQVGVALPRRSVDQAAAGSAVAADPAQLLPGDILVFAARPGGAVSHVGLYTGEGRFIHSASAGVRISRLARDDPDGRWWVERWVGARRVLAP